MKLEKASTYALLALMSLADHDDDHPPATPARVHDIARTTGVPAEYLRKLLRRLLKADLIRSVRGRGGGYVLSQQARDISLLDIVEAIEGPIDQNRLVDDATLDRVDTLPVDALDHWRSRTSDHLRQLLAGERLQALVSHQAIPSTPQTPHTSDDGVNGHDRALALAESDIA